MPPQAVPIRVIRVINVIRVIRAIGVIRAIFTRVIWVMRKYIRVIR